MDFNPRFPRGKRHLSPLGRRIFFVFQSTLPAGEATLGGSPAGIPCDFNPRFPRGKRLPVSKPGQILLPHFNPRFPRGKRLIPLIEKLDKVQFQSTLPAREATQTAYIAMMGDVISIHASRGGSDFDENGVLRFTFKFQSTLPAGEATSSMSCTALPGEISIHASRGGSDQLHLKTTPWSGISIHASRGGSDDCLDLLRSIPDISIHASRGGSDSRNRAQVLQDFISIHASRGGSDSQIFSKGLRN